MSCSVSWHNARDAMQSEELTGAPEAFEKRHANSERRRDVQAQPLRQRREVACTVAAKFGHAGARHREVATWVTALQSSQCFEVASVFLACNGSVIAHA